MKFCIGMVFYRLIPTGFFFNQVLYFLAKSQNFGQSVTPFPAIGEDSDPLSVGKAEIPAF